MNTKRSERTRGTVPAGAPLMLWMLLVALGCATAAWAQDSPREEAAEESSGPDAAGSRSGAFDPDSIEVLVIEGTYFDDERAAVVERVGSDELVNVLTAEEFSKFSAVDVADALKRVAGLNVVEGQFAIIRGLEDRYSSTLFNSAVVPSPDPDSQSIQLDLFPAEVVSNLVVSKTFGPDLPSNSSGGSIDIVTIGYPDELEISVKAKAGLNQRAFDRFLEYESGSPVGSETDGWDTLASEFGGSIGGRSSLFGREIRYKLVGNWGLDYDTAEGWQEDREPRTREAAPPNGDLQIGELSLTSGRFELTTSDEEEQAAGFGSFGFDLDEASNHSIDLSLFWTQKNEDTVQLKENGFFPRFDYLKPGGPVDLETQGSPVESDVFDGTLPGGGSGNATLASWIAKSRNETNDPPTRAPLWFSSFFESKSFTVERDLLIPQINGDHHFDDLLPGLSLRWAANYAKTTQTDESLGARMWYEPCGYGGGPQLVCPEGVTRIPIPTEFPVTVNSLGPGKYIGNSAIFRNETDIDEDQWFGRLDAEYQTDLSDWLAVALRSGLWYERATRDVESEFLQPLDAAQNPLCVPTGICSGGSSDPAVFADSAQELGETLFGFAFARDASGSLIGTGATTNDAKREIQALALGSRTTLWQNLDLLAGLRLEDILIESNNDPFQPGGTDVDESPLIFPSKYVFFDRFGDNPAREFARPPPYNDEVLGFPVRPGICRGPNPAPGVAPPPIAVLPGTCVDLADQAEIEQFVNGEIDEVQYLPSVGITWRPLEGLALRAAWSQTVARPSFREMGYYATVEPASDDIVVGNPQLQLSDVENYDLRAEYFFGSSGDLVAISGFYKTIEDPIESIILRNPADFNEASSAFYRTFFNNPNEATLWGVELEARKNLAILGEAGRGGLHALGAPDDTPVLDFLDYLSLGGNFTWIEAEVDRSEAELTRASRFFAAGSTETLNQSRRLFGQPEWIANADVSFDHPDWGTRATLAFYAISDVLDAAGAANVGRNAQIDALTLDRYVDSFHTLDLIVRQSIWQGLAVKFTAKNLTDSRRQIVYDPVQTSDTVEERSFKVGRDFSLELSYTFYELPFLFED